MQSPWKTAEPWMPAEGADDEIFDDYEEFGELFDICKDFHGKYLSTVERLKQSRADKCDVFVKQLKDLKAKVRYVGKDVKKHADVIALLREQIRTLDDPSGLFNSSIEDFISDGMLDQEQVQKMLFSLRTYWTERKVEILKQDSELKKRISWPIAELNDNARSIQLNKVIETERDRLKTNFNKLVGLIVELEPTKQFSGSQIQEMLAEIYEDRDNRATLKIQKVYRGFKTRRAFKFIKAVIQIQRFVRLRKVEQQQIKKFELKD